MLPKIGIQLGNEFLKADDVDEQDKIQSIYGQMNIFNGFKDASAISNSKTQLAISENSLKNSILLKELSIEQKFYQLLFLRKKSEILNSELTRSISHISMVKKRLTSKIITETDLLEFKLYRKKLESLITYTKLESDSVQNQLLATASLANGDQYTIWGTLPHYSVTTNLSDLLAMGNNSFGVKEQVLKSDLAKQTAKAANSGWYPSIDLRLEHGHLDEAETGIDSDEVSSRAIVLATWELFSGGKTTYQRKSRLKEIKSLEYSSKQTILNYEIQVTNLYKKLNMLEQTILSEEENAKLSKALYRRTLKEYKKGIKDSGALASSSKELSEAQSRVYQLKFNYVLAKVQLEQATGERLEFKIVSHDKE